MSWLHQIEAARALWEPMLLTFMLVLSRVSGLVATAPLLGAREAPLRVRAFLAVTISALVTPLAASDPVAAPQTVLHVLTLAAGELVIGATLGLGVMIIFGGIQVAGQLIGQMSGMSLGEVFNPGFNEEIPAISQLLFYVTMAVFAAVGGYRYVMAALLDTFTALPLGQGTAPLATVDSLVTLLGESFVLGVRAAAPVIAALLLSTVVLGLIARTLPQLNALALGVPLNTIVALGTLAVSLGAMVTVFQDQIEDVIDVVARAVT